jgi:hypothetical protein
MALTACSAELPQHGNFVPILRFNHRPWDKAKEEEPSDSFE